MHPPSPGGAKAAGHGAGSFPGCPLYSPQPAATLNNYCMLGVSVRGLVLMGLNDLTKVPQLVGRETGLCAMSAISKTCVLSLRASE